MRKLLIGLALSVMAASAQAQWVFVAEGVSGNKVYADPATKSRNGHVVRIWELNDYAKSNGKAQSDRSFMEINCAERTRQTLQVAMFARKMATGELVGSINKPVNKQFVPPGTISEAMLNFACK
jgi:hypothetical protein